LKAGFSAHHPDHDGDAHRQALKPAIAVLIAGLEVCAAAGLMKQALVKPKHTRQGSDGIWSRWPGVANPSGKSAVVGHQRQK